jgi:hypothetical protein
MRPQIPLALIVLAPIALASSALGACASAASAQDAGSLPRVLELPASTRAMALGDAYMMDAQHADALFYHPALLRQASGFGLELQLWGDEASAVAASAATQWLGGGIGIGLLTLQHGAPSGAAVALPPGQDDLFELGPTPASERVAVLGYARRLVGIDFGVAGKLIDQRADLSREQAMMMDVGAAAEVGPLHLGLTVRDIGSDPLVEPDDATPRVVLGAGAYGRELGIFDIGVTGAAHWSEDRTTASGGVEIGYWPINGRTFVARFGFQDPPDGSELSAFSFGFAFWGDDITAEWAFRPYSGDASAGTHRFGVRWR